MYICDGFQIVVCSLLRSPSLYIRACALGTFTCRPCPKVIVSRLIGDDWDRENGGKTLVTQSSRFGFLNLNI